MKKTKNYIAFVSEAARAKGVTAPDDTSSFSTASPSHQSASWRDYLLEVLVDLMVAFWSRVFPVLLLAGLGIYAIAQSMGVSFSLVLGGLVFISVIIFSVVQGMR